MVSIRYFCQRYQKFWWVLKDFFVLPVPVSRKRKKSFRSQSCFMINRNSLCCSNILLRYLLKISSAHFMALVFFHASWNTSENQIRKPEVSWCFQGSSRLILAAYCEQYSHAVSFLRKEMPCPQLKPPKTHSIFFFYLGFLSQPFMNHRTAREGALSWDFFFHLDFL